MSLTQPSFATPEAAAMDGFPPAHCRVVASATQGDDGIVVLDTGAPGRPYLYAVAVWREAGRWSEGSSSNGLGWTLTDPDNDLGTLAAWDYAPAGADRVRVAFRDEVRELPVADGTYLTAWWRVACPEDDWPRAVEFRVAGVWIPQPTPRGWPFARGA